jgi:DNA-binding CsgD family transcriptional regulator
VRIELGHRTDDLVLLLVDAELFDATPHGEWLRQRYAEIVPVVLPDVLRCIESGGRLSDASRACVRASADASRSVDVPFAVALRGGVPALRAFAALVQSFSPALTVGETTVLMGRAGIIAQELGACWVEAWQTPECLTDAVPPDDPDTIAIVAKVPVENDAADPSPVFHMVAMAAEGASTEQIAAATAYSTQAVKWHLGRLMKSWHVANRAGLVGAAFARGVLIARRRPRQ